MITHPFDNGRGPAVADTEPFPGPAPDEYLPGRGTVKGHVAHDDVLLGPLGVCHRLEAVDVDADREDVGNQPAARDADDVVVLELGADAVGMSTVMEVITANQMGMKVLGISCLTNMAAGILPQKLDHREVMETGERVRGVFLELLRELVPALAKLDKPLEDRQVQVEVKRMDPLSLVLEQAGAQELARTLMEAFSALSRAQEEAAEQR